MVVWNDFRNDARVLKEAQTLQAVGYQVTVFALHTPGLTPLQEVLGTGVRVLRIARSPLWKWRKQKAIKLHKQTELLNNKKASRAGRIVKYVQQLLRIVARIWSHLVLLIKMVRSAPDIIHAHDVNTLPLAWLVSIVSRSPLVYDAHEISTGREGYASFRTLVWCIEKYLMPHVAGAITTTDTRAKYFARAYGIQRPLVLQNRPRFSDVSRTQRIRQELKLDQPWPIVLYQGGLQQGRGLERLVEAASMVENAYFVFVGGGRLEAMLKDRVQSLMLDKRAHFIPTVALDELLNYTASADIGVQPIENTCLNHFSTDSNKLFEYVQAGLPVIASDLPEIRRIVKEHDLGLLVPEGDTNALAKAINELVQDTVKRNWYSKNCQKAARFLTWEAQEHALINLYRCLLQGQDGVSRR